MFVPQIEPYLDDNELIKLTECIRDNWITGGKKVKEFEHRIADLCHVKRTVACCNGTMALFMGLKALGIKQGDEVIVPDFTFIASANAVVLAGGIPVFVDVDKNSLNINTDLIEKVVTINTKAIMPVHIYGQSADMDLVNYVADKYSLKVIEDAAQGIGVKWRNNPVGGLSDVGCLSFYGDKTLTSGEGGMILTNNDELADTCLRLENQGNLSKGNYIAESIGFNFRMTDLQAAIGLAQLDKLDDIISKKRFNEQLYKSLLEGYVEFLNIDDRCVSVPFRVVIFVDNPQKLSDYLKLNGIETRRVFYPLHLQPCYNTDGHYPVSERAYKRGLALPSSAKLTEAQINYVCDKIKEFYV